MFIGHYAFSLGLKPAAKELRLFPLIVAVQGLDFVFSVLVLIGREHMRIVPGFTAVNPYELYDMAISHSLAMAVAWSAVAFVLARGAPLTWRDSWVLAVAVFSHWPADLLVHTADLPLTLHGAARVGFGLWRSRLATLAIEGSFFAAGLYLYQRGRHPKPKFWIFAGVLGVLLVATPFFPEPPSPQVFAAQSLVTYVAIAAAAWWAER